MLQTIRNIFKIEDLRKRIVYTLLMLAIVRLGALIPSPLMNAEVVKTYFASANSVMQLFDIMSGNAFSQMNLFAMGITPYINSSIIISLLTVAIPKLQELQEDGESGRKKITQYTRYLTIILALIQSFGISFGLRSVFTSSLGTAWSIIVSMAVFTAGSMFTMWIGENITEKGIGNGISLIIMVNVLSRVPALISQITGYGKWWLTVIIVIVLLFMCAFIVVLELAERRIPIQYAKRMQGRKVCYPDYLCCVHHEHAQHRNRILHRQSHRMVGQRPEMAEHRPSLRRMPVSGADHLLHLLLCKYHL